MSWGDNFSKFVRSAFLVTTLIIWPVTFFLTFDKSYFTRIPQTIFTFDYQAHQEKLRNLYAYPTVFLARLFQNKAVVPIGKFEHNLTALLDPNNYFFGFHPREIISGNQNAVKFPFVSLPVFALSLFVLLRSRRGKIILSSFAIFAIALSFLANFDRYDFLLFFPLSLVFLAGFKKIPTWYPAIALPFALIELFRQIIIFAPR